MTFIPCYSSAGRISCSFPCNISGSNVTSIRNLIRRLTIWRDEEWFGATNAGHGAVVSRYLARPTLPSFHPTYLIREQSNKRCEMFSINLILRMSVVLYYRMEGPIASSRSLSLFLGRRANRSWSGFPSLPFPFAVLEFYPKEYRKVEVFNSIVYNIIIIINHIHNFNICEVLITKMKEKLR